MSMSKIDPRIERSRQAIRIALLDCMREKDLRKITVAEITRRAGLSRPTFYLHYTSIAEVLVEYLADVLHQANDTFSTNIEKMGGAQAGLVSFITFFQDVGNHADLFRLVSQIGAENTMREYFYASFVLYLDDYAARHHVQILPTVRHLSASFLVGALVGVIYYWLDAEIQIPAEQMGSYFASTMNSYLGSVIVDRNLDPIFQPSE